MAAYVEKMNSQKEGQISRKRGQKGGMGGQDPKRREPPPPPKEGSSAAMGSPSGRKREGKRT